MIGKRIYLLAIISLISCKPEPVVLKKINALELAVYPFDVLTPLDSTSILALAENDNLTGWSDLESLLMDDYPDGDWESLLDQRKQAFTKKFIDQREFYEFPFEAGAAKYSFILINFQGDFDEDDKDITVYSKPQKNDNELIVIAEYTNLMGITEFTKITECTFLEGGNIITQTFTKNCSDVLSEDDKTTCFSDTLKVTYRTNRNGELKEIKRHQIKSSYEL
ncbi:hypothetical protein EV198_0071 [Roseivirga ehrenbergii]|uniref:Lipoprotein n=1 Tax=Roseivirga ehrenbergii (strain DSM 102268 / JCM 13514 / KCTC 12282 / NCIMB 14502 / KMM 6017) TaxID=279360 RepID=A0A150WZZ0_ROSEK|nr:hypothetical protein [Roseivirga ehrenbergii]KYG72027.1 hypothetical protein MB14_08195 [Roseivirga ehrenbergii]TCL13249.1 hypothetical protein EV198_0071 [Roseivirga ehrenbergii]